MAISRDDLLISIQADTKGAATGIGQLRDELGRFIASGKQTQAAVAGIEHSALGLGEKMKELAHWAEGSHKAMTGFGAAQVVWHSALENLKAGFEAVHKAWEMTVGKFVESEDSVRKLATTLALMGQDDMPAMVKEMRAFSGELAEASTVSEETAMKLLQLAAAAGMPGERAMTTVRAAANVAAATGREIGGVFDALRNSTKGMTRGIAEFAPELANMSAETAKAGGAIDYLDKKFQGFAREELATASGQMKVFKNVVEESMRAVGGAIVAGLDIDLSKGGLLKAAEGIRSSLHTLVPVVTDVVAGVKALASAISDVLIVSLESLSTPARTVYNTLIDIKDVVTFQAFAKGGAGAFANLREQWTSTAASIAGSGKDMKNSFMEFYNVVHDSSTAATRQGADLDKMLGEIDKKNTHVKPPKIISDDQLKLLDELGKMLEDLGRKTALIGATEAQKAHIETIQQQQQLDLMAKRLKMGGALTAQAKEQLAAASALLRVQETAKMHEAQAKAIEDAGAQIRQNNKFLRDFGETQQTIIDNQLQADLADIDRLEAKAIKEGVITDQLKDQLDTMRAQAREKADMGKGDILKGFRLFQPEDISKIQAALGAGAGGFAASVSSLTAVPLQMVGAAGMFLDAAQKLVDFAPQFLEKIAHLVDSFTDLPTKLADAVGHIADAILRNITQGIPKIFAMIERLDDIATNFLTKLPDAFIALMQKLPELVNHLVDRIPQLIRRLGPVLIAGIPRVVAQFVRSFVSDGPKIAHEVMRVVVKELPPAIRDAIREAGQELMNAFRGVSMPKLDFGDTFKQLGDTVQKQSSKLFEVIDASAATLGTTTAGQISDAINGAMNRAFNLLKQLWAALRDLWQWVWDHVLSPFVEALTKAWRWVYDNVLSPLGDLVQRGWQWVVDKVLSPLGGIVAGAWSWVVDKVLLPLEGIGQRAFQWVYDEIYLKLAGVGQVAFQWVYDEVVLKLWGVGQAAFQWVYDNVVLNLLNAGKAGFQWVYDNIVRGLQQPVAWLHDFADEVNQFFQTPAWVTAIENTVTKLFNFQWPSFPSFQLPGAGGGGGGGVTGVLSQIASPFPINAGASPFARGGMVYAAGGAYLARGNDRIGVMAEPGEFMIRRRAVDAVGPGVLSAINRTGQVPGGQVVHLDIGGIKIENHGQAVDDSFVRNKLMPQVYREIKKASSEGRFLVSTRGLRNV